MFEMVRVESSAATPPPDRCKLFHVQWEVHRLRRRGEAHRARRRSAPQGPDLSRLLPTLEVTEVIVDALDPADRVRASEIGDRGARRARLRWAPDALRARFERGARGREL